ncbi:MAG: protein kinase, partial [Bacteroidetes bacterium]|nr:protein kinase [Bacteroidota bacterium]
MDDAVIGKEVDGYHIESILGRGGMGVVYRAEDVALSRPVALKRINPAQAHREQFLRRFRAEAKALARINSPFITSIYALRDTDIGLLIVMEYVDGGTLKDRIVEGPMRPAVVVPIVRQILRAFRDAHGAGVIHRDIKPQNIMLTSDGAVKITDFGIAKLRRQDSGETVTQGGQGGTLKYMSPEQIEKIDQVDNRSDLYALGMTMYEMLAGR